MVHDVVQKAPVGLSPATHGHLLINAPGLTSFSVSLPNSLTCVSWSPPKETLEVKYLSQDDLQNLTQNILSDGKILKIMGKAF